MNPISLIPLQTAQKGAEHLFVLSNDAWFFESSGTEQHAQAAAIRAVEQDWGHQVANTGYTISFDYGEENIKFAAPEDGIAQTNLPQRRPCIVAGEITFFLCCIILFVLPLTDTFHNNQRGPRISRTACRQGLPEHPVYAWGSALCFNTIRLSILPTSFQGFAGFLAQIFFRDKYLPDTYTLLLSYIPPVTAGSGIQLRCRCLILISAISYTTYFLTHFSQHCLCRLRHCQLPSVPALFAP